MAFLESGINQHGEMVLIGNVGRGRQADLSCPYCGIGLIAKKGKKLTHHFAHDGETCLESARTIQLLGYDQFDIHVPGWLWSNLQRFHAGRGLHSDRHYHDLERHGFISSGFRSYILTHRGKVPFGEASLSKFEEVQKEIFKDKHDELLQKAIQALTSANTQMWLTDLMRYRAQLRRLLTLDLYFLEIKHNEGILYKIGVTSRDISDRIEEIQRDLSTHGISNTKIKPLRQLTWQAPIEHYFKHRYKMFRAPIGKLTEYFYFEKRRNVLSDLSRLGNRGLDAFEQDVVKNALPAKGLEIQEQLQRQALGEKIKQGMATAAAAGTHVGRPSENDQLIVAKYPAVVQAIKNGQSRRKTAQATGVSVPTVRKVHEAMTRIEKEGD